jgi:hypothetical protein
MNHSSRSNKMASLSKRALQKYAQEEMAGYLVAAALGESFNAIHLGSFSDSFDCLLTNSNVPEVALEVTTDADPKYEELTNALFQQPKGEAVCLTAGLGRWIINLEIGARVNQLTIDSIEGLLTQLLTRNCAKADKTQLAANHPTRKKLEALRIASVRRIDFAEDIAFRMMPMNTGSIDDSPNLLADHLERLSQQRNTLDKINRLISRADHLRPHLAILEGSGSGLSVQFRMQGLSLRGPKPIRAIELPTGLDSLWFISATTGRSISFSLDLGWREHFLSNDPEPWWKTADLPILNQLYQFRTEGC